LGHQRLAAQLGDLRTRALELCVGGRTCGVRASELAFKLLCRSAELCHFSTSLLELVDALDRNPLNAQLRHLAVSALELGARLGERRLSRRAFAYQRSDPGVQLIGLRTRLLELGARLRQCRSGRFELV